MKRTDELLSEHRERVYRALKLHDFDLYRRCIQAGEGVTLNHGIENPRLAADIEAAIVLSVADALGVKAKPGTALFGVFEPGI